MPNGEMFTLYKSPGMTAWSETVVLSVSVNQLSLLPVEGREGKGRRQGQGRKGGNLAAVACCIAPVCLLRAFGNLVPAEYL